METEEPVIQGFLFLPSSGKILKKLKQKKYCLLYKRSSSGVARIEIFENDMQTGQAKIITLEDVVKITQKSFNILHVLTKNSVIELETLLDENLNDWLEALRSVVFPDENTGNNSIEQDNDLYCSADEGVFYVKLHPSEASKRCNLPSKNYTLVVTPTALQLRNESDNKLLYTWPFSYIRKYGYKGGKFTFEAGRKCASGQGVFYLEHPNHNEIYRCLSTKLKNMKKMLNGDPTSSLIDSGDIQLHAALNMEAGSRNPLPPMSIQSSFQDSSKPSLGLHYPSSISLNESFSVAKIAPTKPPRKAAAIPKDVTQSITPIVTINAFHEYIDVNQFNAGKYDSVESRKEAWKTMGIQEPPHSELIPSTGENTYSSWGNATLKKSLSEMKLSEKNSGPAVITEPTTCPSNKYFDRLQHFGSSSALNVTSGYKKVIPKTIESLSYAEESRSNCDDYASCSALASRKSTGEIKQAEKATAPTVISEPIQSTDEQGYDHLNFLGQPTALNSSSDYKQVISSASAPAAKTGYNLYEEVSVIESVRSADDSHLGYARIKKDSATGALKVDECDAGTVSYDEVKEEELQKIAHQFENHQPYAVISKPKRV